MPTEFVRLAHNPWKVWIQLGGAAGDIDSRDGRASRKQFENALGDFASHDLRPLWPCLHVTVVTGLVAKLADVDLQGCGLLSDQSSTSVVFQRPLKIMG